MIWGVEVVSLDPAVPVSVNVRQTTGEGRAVRSTVRFGTYSVRFMDMDGPESPARP